MADYITVTYDEGQTIKIRKGSSLDALLKRLPPRERVPVAATVNGALQELDYQLYIDSAVKWVDYNSNLGWRIYQRSLIFLLLLAVKELYPDRQLWVSHSLSEGLFCRLDGGEKPITPSQVKALQNKMQEYVNQDIKFERSMVSLSDAVAYFRTHGNEKKAELIEARKEEYLALYTAGGISEYFFGLMSTRAGLLTQFALIPFEHGFVLRLPARRYLGCRDRSRIVAHQLHATLEKYGEWSTLMGIQTVSDLNQVVRAGEREFTDLVLVSENLYERSLRDISDQVMEDFPTARLIMLAGPSSSGKTTSAKRLSIEFRTIGIKPVMISLDDYFVDRDKTPLDKEGKPDYEGLAALDLELFQINMRALLAGFDAALPRYNFKTGKSEPEYRYIKLEDDQVLIVEGIHALNEKLLAGIPPEMVRKVFVSALTQLNLDSYTTVSASDNRLIRRMVRDMQFRGMSPIATLEYWDEVRKGEHHNIFPWQERADFFINSALIYELPVLRPLIEDSLSAITPDQSCYLEARRMLRLIRYFAPAPADIIPRTSILQEFIGQSIFDV